MSLRPRNVRVSQPAQVIPAPTSLKLKLGSKLGGIDPDAIAKAEAALKSLSGQFAQWLQDEMDKLDTARAAVRTNGWNAATAEGVYFRAHDLKGLGSTYEYPIITKLGASLCRLLDEPDKRSTAPLMLVDAHIDAMKAAIRDNIRDVDHPVGKALTTELDNRVSAHLAD